MSEIALSIVTGGTPSQTRAASVIEEATERLRLTGDPGIAADLEARAVSGAGGYDMTLTGFDGTDSMAELYCRSLDAFTMAVKAAMEGQRTTRVAGHLLKVLVTLRAGLLRVHGKPEAATEAEQLGLPLAEDSAE